MSTKTLKIISADDRLAEKGGPKLLLIGPSGVGKTSTLHTLSAKLLASTLAFDIEAGLIAVSDLQFASVRPRTWDDCRNLACVLGGPNPALPATATYSEAHFNELMKDDELARLTSYTTRSSTASPVPGGFALPGRSSNRRRLPIAVVRICARSTGCTPAA